MLPVLGLLSPPNPEFVDESPKPDFGAEPVALNTLGWVAGVVGFAAHGDAEFIFGANGDAPVVDPPPNGDAEDIAKDPKPEFLNFSSDV